MSALRMVQSMYIIKANPYAGSDRRCYVANATAMRADEIEEASLSWTGQNSVDLKFVITCIIIQFK
jgi:hypothetical protein